MENIASFGEHEDGEGYNISQYIGAKSAGHINYANKTIEWTIRVNMDQRPMKDVVIEDSLGDGLTLIEDSIEMTIGGTRSEEHTSELQSRGHLVCRLLLEKKKRDKNR